jgi:hypothetical protein
MNGTQAGGGIILKLFFFLHRRGFELNSGNYGPGFPGSIFGQREITLSKLTVSGFLIVMKKAWVKFGKDEDGNSI